MVLIWPHYLTIFYGFASSRNVETAIFLADVVFRKFIPFAGGGAYLCRFLSVAAQIDICASAVRSGLEETWSYHGGNMELPRSYVGAIAQEGYRWIGLK
jgi:hypothetical protein